MEIAIHQHSASECFFLEITLGDQCWSTAETFESPQYHPRYDDIVVLQLTYMDPSEALDGGYRFRAHHGTTEHVLLLEELYKNRTFIKLESPTPNTTAKNIFGCFGDSMSRSFGVCGDMSSGMIPNTDLGIIISFMHSVLPEVWNSTTLQKSANVESFLRKNSDFYSLTS